VEVVGVKNPPEISTPSAILRWLHVTDMPNTEPSISTVFYNLSEDRYIEKSGTVEMRGIVPIESVLHAHILLLRETIGNDYCTM
jgi:hypothetical protein